MKKIISFFKEIKTGTVVRTLGLGIAFANQLLAIKGLSPIPFDAEQTELWVSTGVTAIVSLLTWWKNNSFTDTAIQADNYLKSMKEESKK